MLKSIFFFLFVITLQAGVAGEINGQQPKVAIDTKGTLRMVYGQGEKIYCLTSVDGGKTFASPVLVGQLSRMHLGHTRGPEIASSRNFSMITAIDETGAIHSYKLDHSKSRWTEAAPVNDQKGSAVEGLMSLTADQQDNFYAAWLDIRLEKMNNIFFSSMNGRTSSWSKNVLVYQSPDKHTCECCKPNIAINNNKLVVGFRNWLMGSRDIYYATSANKGKSFSTPVKSGQGTWQLNACPMDGGGIAVDERGAVSAAWRRNSDVFYASGNQKEQKLGTGRDVSMSRRKGETVIVWQDDKKIQLRMLKSGQTLQVGAGVSPRVYLLDNSKTFCVWEDEGKVRYKLI